MTRLRYTNLKGTIQESPKLLLSDVVMACPPSAPAVASPFILPFTFEPDGVKEEISWVTSHIAGAAIWTIARHQEGTTAFDHDFGTVWEHGPTAADFYPPVDFHVKSPAYGAKGGAVKRTDAIIIVGTPSAYWQRSRGTSTMFKRGSQRTKLHQKSRFGNGWARAGRFGPNANNGPSPVGNKSRFLSAIPATPTILYSPSSNFTNAIVGLLINVKLAGVNGVTLRTSIASVIDGQHIVLTDPASSNIS